MSKRTTFACIAIALAVALAPTPTPTPTPTATPTPTPVPCVFNDLGSVAVGSSKSASGNWTSGCRSISRPGRYARFYRVSLTADASVRIDLTSATDAYLFLRSGAGAARTSVEASDLGSILASDDDSGSGRNARIERALDRGTYTIEATTFRREATGSFTLALRASATPTPTPTPSPTPTWTPTPTPTATPTPTSTPTPTPTPTRVTVPLPPRPTNFRSTAQTETSVTVQWTRPSGTFTSYQVRYRKIIADAWTTTNVSRSSVSKVITGLTCNTLYRFSIRTRTSSQGGSVIRTSSWVSTNQATSKCSVIRVGSITRFGSPSSASISKPSGLAWVPNRSRPNEPLLYMVDDNTDALYIMNTTTGQAGRVGNATQFGASISSPRGLVWDGSSLLLLTPTALYKLSESTGVATPFRESPTITRTSAYASALPFGTGITGASGVAAYDRRLFMVDSATNSLYVVDRSTGSAYRIGMHLLTSGKPSALELVGSTLYMSSTEPSALHTVSRASGRATTFRSPLSLTSIKGLAWNDRTSTMYAVDDSTDALYTLPVVPRPQSLPPASADNDADPYLPDGGDLYYNGDSTHRTVKHSFIDSVMRWDNPRWHRNCAPNARTTTCSTYEHDLELDFGWINNGCTTWTTLPDSYNDCRTAGLLEPDGSKIIISFGTYRAPAIQSGKIYYGSWNFLNVFATSRTGKARLLGQEGRYTCWIVKHYLCIDGLAVDGKPHQKQVVPSHGVFTWTHGRPFYKSFER